MPRGLPAPARPPFGSHAGGRLVSMKSALRMAALSCLLLTAALVLALAAALQSEPAVALPEAVDPDDVARAMALARQHDPRLGWPGMARAAQLSEHDLGVMLNHGAHRWLNSSTRVVLERGAATVTASVHAPANPFGRWLNVQLRLAETGALPVVDSLRLGRLPVPAWLGERLGVTLLARAGLLEESRLAADAIQQVRFFPQQMWVRYVWREDSSGRIFAALLPAADQDRLRVYAEHLADTLADAPDAAAPVSLAALLPPMFALARKRSGSGSGDGAAAAGAAAAENRAALIVLTLYVNGQGIEALAPAVRPTRQAAIRSVTLAGRDDFPRHWLISAALAAEGTGPLSRAIGIYKEIADSRGGSGFSFNDIAADRAGTRLGELALEQSRRLQAALAAGVQESDLMPAWADLPEFMPEPEFKRRYGGVGAPAYAAMLAEIDRRVAALRVLR